MSIREYDSLKWRKRRIQWLNRQPLCKWCGSSFNSQVDHIVPFKDNLKLFWDWGNLQTLCMSCHAEKTNQDESLLKLPRTGIIEIVSQGEGFELGVYLNYFGGNYRQTFNQIEQELPKIPKSVFNIKGIPDNYLPEYLTLLLKINNKIPVKYTTNINNDFLKKWMNWVVKK